MKTDTRTHLATALAEDEYQPPKPAKRPELPKLRLVPPPPPEPVEAYPGFKLRGAAVTAYCPTCQKWQTHDQLVESATGKRFIACIRSTCGTPTEVKTR